MTADRSRDPIPVEFKTTGVSKGLIAAAVTLAVAVVLLLAISAWLLLGKSSSGEPAGTPVQVEIESGASTAAIAQQLADEGVVGSALAFRITSRLSHADGRLKPGSYALETGMPAREVIGLLERGPATKYVTVTIPEGWTIDKIAERLEQQAGISAAEFKSVAKTQSEKFAGKHPYLAGAYGGSLEGYLFPKTYRVKTGSSAAQVIEMMLDQFDREMASVDLAGAQARGMTEPQVVTIASMIERESRLDPERPLVSSVIQNRLKTDSFLKIDATIEYVLGTSKFRLSSADVRIDSPYNTYTHKGLPPGPIANPGLKSLQAAASPADTKLLYYVLTGKDGSHTFTTNLKDFLVAKQKSKEVFGK